MKRQSLRPLADYEKHKENWLLWPSRADVWRDKALPAQKVFAKVANIIAKYEKVSVGTNTQIDHTLLDSHINIVPIKYDDAWVRDIAPTFLIEESTSSITAIKWGFNAWGEVCYSNWEQDSIFGKELCNYLQVPFKEAPIILEGGTFIVDHVGTIIISRNCIINSNRNPQLTLEKAEEILKEYLHVKKIIWVTEGIYGDETGGHVDNICNFIAPHTLALAWTDNKDDPQYNLSQQLYDRLQEQTDAEGNRFVIHKIPLPDPVFITENESASIQKKEGTMERKPGTRLAASYINFYIGDKFVLLPTFNDKKDKEVIDIFKTLLPNKDIIGVYSKEILLGGGNIHCIATYFP